VLDGFDPKGLPQLRPATRPITLRHLLTHTAGFSYEHWSADIQAYQKAMDLPGIGSCRNAALRMPLTFDPGERWQYGINIDFVGKMVEAISGKQLGEYLRENLFAALGMDSTAFRITPDMRARLAKVHERRPDGSLKSLEFVMIQEPEFEMGGGGLYSTAGDYLKFVRMMLNGGKGNGNQVLKPETVTLMSTNAMGDLKVNMLRSALPHRTVDAEFFPGMPKSWGLSFMINTAKTPVEDQPNLTLKLTLTHKRFVPRPSSKSAHESFILDGVEFDTGKATIRPGSFARLDNVVEYMTHKPNSRIEISGHTDNVGKKEDNKILSQKRAHACRDYLIKKGIDGSRIEAVGYGDELPIGSNDTPAGRQKNRRIVAGEL
jgi:outer membrane protein OmpA-like peptidoglycan-associated protein